MSPETDNAEQADVLVVNRQGLHARPVTQFAQLANQFASKIEVSNGEITVDGKSVMSMMRLAAEYGTSLHLTAKGPDAAKALRELAALVKRKFGEE